MSLKSIIIILACLAALTVNAQLLPASHNDIANQQTEMSKLVANTFLDQSLDDVAKHSPFAGIANEFIATEAEPQLASSLVSYSKRFLGTRYLLGGTTPRAFDCSGFVGYVYRNFGINLDRTSRQQYLQGNRISVGELQPGDLLFFSCRSSGRGNVGHVAMVVSVDRDSNSCKFIHASTKKGVTYQKFPDNGYYSRNFIGAKRILGSKIDVTQNGKEGKNIAQL